MSSEVEICRMALDLIGDYALSDLAEGSKQARLRRRNFAPMRDAVLRAHPWNCALTRTTLPKDAAAPAFGFARQYTLPADCLRLLPLTRDGAFGGAPVAHRIEGRRLLTDAAAPLPVVYVRRVADTAVFDAALVQAIAARLAWQIAYNLTGSRTKQAELGQVYREILKEARRIDGMEGTPEPQTASAWLIARDA